MAVDNTTYQQKVSPLRLIEVERKGIYQIVRKADNLQQPAWLLATNSM